jgi:flagellar biosynthesis protein FliP
MIKRLFMMPSSRVIRASRRGLLMALLISAAAAFPGRAAMAQTEDDDLPGGPMGLRIQFDSEDRPEDVSKSIQILLLITALSLAPSAIIMCTSFTRILIVFGLLRNALGTQQTPPGQILAGMSLFLTIFVMMPVWERINEDALKPYMAEEITQADAFEKGLVPLREFMINQTGNKEIALFLELSKTEMPEKIEEMPMPVLIPAFMMSELKTAFQMGFLMYLPFLVIDLVIASSLMSLGMMMLPPMMISLPLKMLMFVLADGWTLITRGLVTSF